MTGRREPARPRPPRPSRPRPRLPECRCHPGAPAGDECADLCGIFLV